MSAELARHLRQDERHVIARDQLRAARLQVGNARLGAGNAIDLDGQALLREKALRLGDVKPAFLGGGHRVNGNGALFELAGRCVRGAARRPRSRRAFPRPR